MPVLAVLQRVADSETFSEERLFRVAAFLTRSGLPTSREMRLGFPSDDTKRLAEIKGLAAEAATYLGNERPHLRLQNGTLVDKQSAADYMLGSAARPSCCSV